jgi:hypothetical protein
VVFASDMRSAQVQGPVLRCAWLTFERVRAMSAPHLAVLAVAHVSICTGFVTRTMGLSMRPISGCV